MRVGLPQFVQMSITLPMGTGWLISRMPPGSILGTPPTPEVEPSRGLVWRFAVDALDDHADIAGRGAAAEDAAGAARRGLDG